jgi:hypothetical protein
LIASDGINSVRSPYRVILRGVEDLPPALKTRVSQFAGLFAEAREERGLQVSAIIEK